MTIEAWLQKATEELKRVGVSSARLDAELILEHTIKTPRTYIHAHGDEILDDKYRQIADARLELRKERTPLAYLIGYKEFYGRNFKTTPAALIPRPESETIIELLAKVIPKLLSESNRPLTLADIGTGTGCLGITAKLEWPELNVVLSDIDQQALNLAKENASANSAKVNLVKNDLLRSFGIQVDILVANLPYVDKKWQVSPETHAEPSLALYADNQGLSLIYKLLDQALLWLNSGGYVLLESDARQIPDIINYAESLGYKHLATEGLITLFTHQ